MKIQYFPGTDTQHIQSREAAVAETRNLDDNALLVLDGQGNICCITIEHASASTC